MGWDIVQSNLFIFNSKYWKIFKVILFCVVFIFVLTKTDRLFRTNEPTIDYGLNGIEGKSIDAIFVGSSHMGSGINTISFDNEFSINSYSFNSPGMPMIVAEKLINQILKRQEPKIIILEAYSILFEPEKKFPKGYTARILDNMPMFSKEKFSLLREVYSKEERKFKFLNLTSYHDKWKNKEYLISIEPKNPGKYKGFIQYNRDNMMFTGETINYDKYLEFLVSPKKTNPNISEKNYFSLERTAKKLKEKNIKFVVIANGIIPEKERRQNGYLLQDIYSIDSDNRVQEILEKYDAQIITLNKKEMKQEKMDFRNNNHYGLSGTDKVTDVVIDFINKKYLGIFLGINKKCENSTPEYYFYNKESKTDNARFWSFEKNIPLDKELNIIAVKIFKNNNKKYDLFFKIDNVEQAYRLTEEEGKIFLKLFDKEIVFEKKMIPDKTYKSLIYWKYYIRKIKDEYYIYLPNQDFDETKFSN